MIRLWDIVFCVGAFVGAAGWAMNIGALVTGLSGGLAGSELALRALGVPFAPLGAVLGWF
jgi:hypothetical protein